MKTHQKLFENLGSAPQKSKNCTSESNLTGTREWAESNFNFIDGCSNNCKYCYARALAARHKRIATEQWAEEHFREKALSLKVPKKSGMIMVPSSHDITPKNLLQSIEMLKRLLEAGNRLLIVTKPHLECVRTMCDELSPFRGQIQFRFTIGCADSEILKFWEPNAPTFEERLESLKWAYSQGFSTSVSCEPMLDVNIAAVVGAVSPFVTESIWIGKVNRLKSQLSLNGYRDVETIRRAEELLNWQNDNNILKLYYKFRNHPLIQWKDSVRTVLMKYNVSLEQDHNEASSCGLGTAA